MKLSIIIPSYCSQKTIFTMLDSVMAQKTDMVYEVIVVDSTPGEWYCVLEERYPSITVIHRDERTFPGIARNIGAQTAQGEILLFLDADIIVPEDLVEKIVRDLAAGYDVISTAIVSANPDSLVGWCQYLLEFNEFLPESPKGERPLLPGGCLGMKKELFTNRTIFEQSDMYCEDLLMTYRLKRSGAKVYLSPDCMIAHFNKENYGSLMRSFYQLGDGSARMRMICQFPGDMIIRFPVLIVFAGVYKYASIFMKLLRYSRKKLMLYLLLTPLTVPILAAYTAGFFQGRFAYKAYEQVDNVK